MIDVTERQLVEKKVEEIRVLVAKSQVDHCIFETPYKICIQMKKQFICDNSPKVTSTNLNYSPKVDNPAPPFIFSNSVASTPNPCNRNNDSGYSTNANEQETARSELVKTELEISTLKNDLG